MRRLSKSQRIKHNKYVAKITAARKRRFNRNRQTKPAEPGPEHLRPILDAPSHLDLFSRASSKKLTTLVKEIRERVLEKNQDVTINFSNTTILKASALLKLHAEIETLNRLCSRRCVYLIFPTNNGARQLMQRSGFIGHSVQSDLPGVLRAKAYITSPDKGAPLRELFGQMNKSIYDGKLVIDDDQWQTMSGPLAEAINNVQDHAYEHEERVKFLSDVGKIWWIYAETHDDQLYLAFYDKGVGIPKTLSKHESHRKLLRLARKWVSRGYGSDVASIKAAMEYGRSRHKRGGRGRGLTEIRGLVDVNPNGTLHIFSNRGHLKFDAADRRETMDERSDSIHGTLIQWNISLTPPPD